MANNWNSLQLVSLVTLTICLVAIITVATVSAFDVTQTTQAPTQSTTEGDLITPNSIENTNVQDEEDDLEMASSDAKSKWDSKTQAIFKHRPLSSLRKKLKGVKRREDKEKMAPVMTTTSTPVTTEMSPATMPPLMPIVPFDSIYAAASQATYVPPIFDPMAQYLPPPPSFLPRSGPSMLAPIASNPIYLLIQKPPSLTPHPYDALNALPSALIAHMAQLHYDMLQQNRGHSGYINEESDPRDANHGPYSRSGTEKSRSKYSSSPREKDSIDLKQRPDDTNAPLNQEAGVNGNSNSINGGKYDRITDRSGQEKKEFGFGFPGREIDTRDGDLHHSDYHSNGNLLNQDERDLNGNILPMATASATTQSPDSPPYNNAGHRNAAQNGNDHHRDHHDHHTGY